MYSALTFYSYPKTAVYSISLSEIFLPVSLAQKNMCSLKDSIAIRLIRLLSNLRCARLLSV
jgi:hypothetical protein